MGVLGVFSLQGVRLYGCGALRGVASSGRELKECGSQGGVFSRGCGDPGVWGCEIKGVWGMGVWGLGSVGVLVC